MKYGKILRRAMIGVLILSLLFGNTVGATTEGAEETEPKYSVSTYDELVTALERLLVALRKYHRQSKGKRMHRQPHRSKRARKRIRTYA